MLQKLHAPLIALAFFCGASASAQVGGIAPKFLIDPASPKAAGQITPSTDQVTFTAGKDGVTVNIAGGPEQYPAIAISPETGAAWDLSPWGRVEAKVTNLGTAGLQLSMRVDNKKDGSSNSCEGISLKAGETKTLKVIFGYSYGYKPGFKLNSGSVIQVLIFAVGKKDVARSFRIEDLQATGSTGEKPPVDPNTVRLKPEKGVILGAGAKLDAAKQVVAKDGAKAEIIANGALKIDFAGRKNESVILKPAMGSWDLTDAYQVQVKLKNTGSTAVSPSIRLESKGGVSDTIAAAAPIPPGGEAVITVPFAAVVSTVVPTDPKQEVFGKGSWSENNWPPKTGTGTKFTSDGGKGVTILPDKNASVQSLTVSSVIANAPPPSDLPSWVGKRPPVDGDWVKTLDENFDGDSLDLHRWNIYTDNFWDKRTHFAKDNAIVKDGKLTLHYEKKTGFHNDDPAGKKTDYACGYADSYGKWRQLYGYFEARVKLPKAPGLWPAFWLMPDRGLDAGPQWKRSDTAKGGMEFDILEFLSGWGPYRYNMAFHWDGYGKEHKSGGTTCGYVVPDKDGFITTGVYWAPGIAIYYVQGKEVLRWESPRVSTVPSFIMFDMVSGGWDNLPLDDAKLPDDFVIDYVRVWQRKDLASPLDGPMPNAGLPSSLSKE
ncbi:MAG: glycoside hydrolase family 16 protein [Opitutaceae bacterium]|jgi:beta-glucanase (GH16 family)